MNLATYKIENIDYTIYTAASGDYCVEVDDGGDLSQYNCGAALEDALKFILSQYQIPSDEESPDE